MDEKVKRTRRGKGEGSIQQRKRDGRWVAVLHLGYLNGKRRTKTFTGKTRQEVAHKLKAGQLELARGTILDTERLTVEQFLERWLENTARPSLRPSTFIRYEIHVRCHLVPALGRIQLQKLTPDHVQALMRMKQAEGLAPNTVKYMRAVLRRALNQALKWAYVSRNAAALVDPPRDTRGEPTTWTLQYVRAFLEAVRGDRLEAFYTVALSIGLRKGEGLALKWSDVDFEKCTLAVRGSLQRIEGELQVTPPKTKQSRRLNKLPQITVAALRSHLGRQLEEKLAAGQAWREAGHIFTTKCGTPIDPRNINRHFDQLVTKAGLPRIRVHDLRHTAAMLMRAQGIDLKTISEVLGHTNIRTTADFYMHESDSAKQAAADAMDALFGSPGGT